ncbi:hypothetical protein MAPG_10422 [Magnaporthiopsis poae ATCC 64411]|uniref:Uncharacterized protein n=1 Tax=Magnaporthiopsis poae (strain ATCC 64411 / 73-15) TaxID=644358 RepID=A0A0C4ECJ5_MAGP6|nr:hypothetical protein MAPG_10422 [Magnaporthiopsis poae ATCC 64411]
MSSNRKRVRKYTPPQRNEPTTPARTQRPRLITSSLPPPESFVPPPQLVPTPDSQNVYNMMREAPMADRLTAPSVRSTAMSRSPSAASSTSLNNGMDGMRVHDSPSPNTRRQRKQPKRNGPLPEPAKLKAAFLRKIGACVDCRGRKVTCDLNHHDLRLFEQGYRNRVHLPHSHQDSYKQMKSPPGFPSIDLSGLLAPDGPPSKTNFTPLDNLPPDLLGVGGAQGFHQPSAPPQQMVTDELDNILWEGLLGSSAASPGTALSPASPMLRHHELASPISPGAVGGGQQPFNNPISPFPSPTRSLPTAQSPSRLVGFGDVAQKPACIAIGRLVNDMGSWECQGGHYGGGPPSVASFSNASTVPDLCRRQHGTLQELLRHYELEHGRYQSLEKPFMFKCSGCEFLSEHEGLQQCPHCPLTLASGRLWWEKWYYGSTLGSASLAAERVTAVPSGGGPFSSSAGSGFSPSSQLSYGSGGHSNWLHPQRQYYFGADGRGRQRRDNKDGGGGSVVSEKDRDDLESEPRATTRSAACPLRHLVPATLDPMCYSPVDKTCDWQQQPSRSPSRRRSRSRSCVPPPLTPSACPLSAAGRPAAALLLAVGRWLLALLLAALLVCAFAFTSSEASGAARHGNVDGLGPLWCNLLCTWVLLAAGGLLGAWILSTAGVGVDEDAPNLVTVV